MTREGRGNDERGTAWLLQRLRARGAGSATSSSRRARPKRDESKVGTEDDVRREPDTCTMEAGCPSI